MDLKEQIKSRVSITEVASLYVELKPAGKYLKALCPFHTEKTPSFYINPEKESFSCYGCNKFGDIFTLVQELENNSFPEAMNYLIEKFHVPVERTKYQKAVPTDVYASINDIALNYFKNNLNDSQEGGRARQYLKQRGISQVTIDTFSLGYAENRWDGLQNHLQKNSCEINKCVELGLLINNQERNSVYDRFRGRIIFPIFSESGTLVAFGGRTIFDDQNKYLNSPDTPIYKKSKHLYGFNQAKKSIREKKQSILVEGYFDMVSLYQNGVQNAVASLGTALTENQVYLLKRFSDTICIYYDSDKAGIAAAVRGIEKMFEQNINPVIIATTDAKDPDDYIREKGLKAFNHLLENSTDGFHFLVDKISEKYDLNVPEKKNQAVTSIMNFVDKFNEPIVREEYTRMAADYFKLDETIIKSKKKLAKPKSGDGQKSLKGLIITPAERIFLHSILSKPPLIAEIKELFDNKLLSMLTSGNIIRALFDHYNPKSGTLHDYRQIIQNLTEAEQVEFRNLFESSGEGSESSEEILQNVENAVVKFLDIKNKLEAKRIDRDIQVAERDNNIDEIMRLMKEKNQYITNKYKQKMRVINTGGTFETSEG
ncbi:MAG: DNA primase [bacterium]|nr:DNA primase [bacterium]